MGDLMHLQIALDAIEESHNLLLGPWRITRTEKRFISGLLTLASHEIEETLSVGCHCDIEQRAVINDGRETPPPEESYFSSDGEGLYVSPNFGRYRLSPDRKPESPKK